MVELQESLILYLGMKVMSTFEDRIRIARMARDSVDKKSKSSCKKQSEAPC
uniref:Uncharacterized protein n=1 Tax=Arion vulgaris TaxID=1028688 RepID=A0A0B7AIW0_9EUPU